MELPGQARRDVGDARRERADAKRVVRRNEVVTRAADPPQAIPDAQHDRLETSNVALTFFPRDQRANRREPLDEGRTRVDPVAAVDEHPERRRSADRAVILEEPFLIRVRVIRREREDPGRARVHRLAGELGAEQRAESGARDHRDLAGRRFDRRPDDRLVFGWRQRVELARAARRDERGRRVSHHRVHVLPQPVEVDRQVPLERGHGKRDRSLQLRAQLVGRHHHLGTILRHEGSTWVLISCSSSRFRKSHRA